MVSLSRTPRNPSATGASVPKTRMRGREAHALSMALSLVLWYAEQVLMATAIAAGGSRGVGGGVGGGGGGGGGGENSRRRAQRRRTGSAAATASQRAITSSWAKTLLLTPLRSRTCGCDGLGAHR
eukprot:2313603-Prymnesium_polylepis.1